MRKLIFCLILFNGLVKNVAAQTFLKFESAATGRALSTLETYSKLYSSADEAMAVFPTVIQALQKIGYVEASIDRWEIKKDTLIAQCWLGPIYDAIQLQVDSLSKQLLQNYPNKQWTSVNLHEIDSFQHKIIQYLSNEGYPFAKVSLDSVQFHLSPQALLKIDPGPKYYYDSIINVGSAVISYHFLAKYLQIDQKTVFQSGNLSTIHERINNLDFVEQSSPPKIQLTGTGAILQVDLKDRKISQFDFLIGLLPATNDVLRQKLMITGEANILLKNEFGGGETMGLTWQQLQPKSPRLQVHFDQPFIFKSNWGVNGQFQLFKKDSSFVTIQLGAGLKYAIGLKQVGSFFVEQFTSNVIGIDTLMIKNSQKLPDALDVRTTNLGVSHEYNGTDYWRNPRKGIYWKMTGSTGVKQVKENAAILQIKDPNFDYSSLYDTVQLKSYQLKLVGVVDKYIPLGKVSTIKVSAKGGWYQSPQIYRNELFQIGGYKILRGFDEESIYVSIYGVGTIEYRYLIGRNAYLFGFSDVGWVKSSQVNAVFADNMLSFGGGIFLETKAGIIQLALAAGKRNAQNFDMKQAKIHIGYVNYF